MKTIIVFVFGVLVFQQCSSRSLPEESVVSVYTPQPHPDVYHQIATNIADRITSPIYRFLGITKNATESTTTKPWDKIENLDEGEAKSKTIDNDIAETKDVEELSPDALKKKEKPEKITLYSSYLPTSENIERNDTINEISDGDDDDFPLDFDDEKETNRATSPFVYFLELIGSFIQLIYGGIAAFFSSNKPT